MGQISTFRNGRSHARHGCSGRCGAVCARPSRRRRLSLLAFRLSEWRHRLLGDGVGRVLARRRPGRSQAPDERPRLLGTCRAGHHPARDRGQSGAVPPFCRDECLAISMVAAAQHSACPAIRACAVALLGSSKIDEAMQGAEEFALRLKKADQVLSPGTVFMGADSYRPACTATAELISPGACAIAAFPPIRSAGSDLRLHF